MKAITYRIIRYLAITSMFATGLDMLAAPGELQVSPALEYPQQQLSRNQKRRMNLKSKQINNTPTLIDDLTATAQRAADEQAKKEQKEREENDRLRAALEEQKQETEKLRQQKEEAERAKQELEHKQQMEASSSPQTTNEFIAKQNEALAKANDNAWEQRLQNNDNAWNQRLQDIIRNYQESLTAKDAELKKMRENTDSERAAREREGTTLNPSRIPTALAEAPLPTSQPETASQEPEGWWQSYVAKPVSDYVKNNPLTSLGLGAATGALAIGQRHTFNPEAYKNIYDAAAPTIGRALPAAWDAAKKAASYGSAALGQGLSGTSAILGMPVGGLRTLVGSTLGSDWLLKNAQADKTIGALVALGAAGYLGRNTLYSLANKIGAALKPCDSECWYNRAKEIEKQRQEIEEIDKTIKVLKGLAVNSDNMESFLSTIEQRELERNKLQEEFDQNVPNIRIYKQNALDSIVREYSALKEKADLLNLNPQIPAEELNPIHAKMRELAVLWTKINGELGNNTPLSIQEAVKAFISQQPTESSVN